MKYKAEILYEGRVYGKTYNATHPKQVIRKVVKEKVPQIFTLYIINESGNVWVYNIGKINGKYKAQLRRESTIDRDKVYDIFINNLKIREAV